MVTGGAQVTALHQPSAGHANDVLFVFAHGAGGHVDDAGMRALATGLARETCAVLRFNFPYRETASKRPDPMPVLMQCIEDVVAHARERLQPRRLVIGGRSMGGRAASMLAADGFACDALLLLAYPLHPAGQPERRRDAHLPRIAQPTLCCNGTRDALCRQDLMEEVLARLPATFRMHWLDGADHGFHVTRASGRTDDDVLQEILHATERWLGSAG